MPVARPLVPPIIVLGDSAAGATGRGVAAATAVLVLDLASRAVTIRRFSEVPGGVQVMRVKVGTAVGYITLTFVGSTTCVPVTT